ncbi:MAG: ATP-binding cassette domain-containing protein, partial [Achromobacter pestifer]
MSLLVMQDLSGGYADVDIVSGIDMTVADNEIVTIAGTNGAGKSTLVKAVMGLLPRMAGTMTFDGRDLLALPVEERVRLGISYVPQVRNVFGALTVLENLQVVEHVKGREQRILDMFDLFPA